MKPAAGGGFAVAGLLLCAASLASGHVSARIAFGHGVNLLTAASLRAFCASLVVLAFVVSRRAFSPVTRQDLAGSFVLALGVVGQTLLIQMAVKRLPVTVAILLFYTYPFFTALVSTLTGDHRITRGLALSLVAAFSGLLLVLGVSPAGVDPWGVAAAIGAAVVFTGTLTLTPRLAPGLNAPFRTLLMFTAATAVIGGIAVGTDNVRWPSEQIAWASLAGLAAFYALGIVGLYLLLPRLGPMQTAVVLNMEPVFVAVISWLAVGERLTGLQLAGAALVVGAVIANQVRRR